MKSKIKIVSPFILLAFGWMTLPFVSCQQKGTKEDAKYQNRAYENNSVYLENEIDSEGSPYYVEEAIKKQINKLSDAYHEDLMKEMEIDMKSNHVRTEEGTKYKEEGCCELIKVVEQNNPYWVGAEIEDRWYTYTTTQASYLASFYLNYRGYDQTTNQLIHNITIQINPQSCSTNSIWWWWFQVPIPQNVSLHSTCPDPPVRAEFYLYRQFSNIPGPMLCDFEWKVFPLRVDRPNDPPCL